MLRAVVLKEARVQLRSWRFLGGTLLAAALAILGTWVAVDDFNQRWHRHHEQVLEDRQALAAVTVYSMLQPVARRAPTLLGILDEGLETRFGNAVTIDVFTVPDEASGVERRNPFLTSLRDIDFASVVRLALGMLALLVMFDAVSSEKRAGTLQMMLASGLRRSTVFVGKLMGAFAALMVALVVVAGASVAVLLLRAATGPTADDGWRIVGLLVVSGLYVGVMLSFGLVVAILFERPSTGLVMAMLSWLAVVVLLPCFSVAGPRMRPEPAVRGAIAELVAERDARLGDLWRQDALRSGASGDASPFVETGPGRGVVRRYGSARYYDSVAVYHAEEVRLGRRFAERIFDLRRQTEEDAKVWNRLAWLSPAWHFERSTRRLTATSLVDQEDFLAACRAYRGTLIDYLEARQAFRAWRWFTDDPSPPPTWPSLFGLQPEDVTAANIAELTARFRSPAIQARFQRDRSDPTRHLVVDDLAPFTLPSRPVTVAWQRTTHHLGFLSVLGIGAMVIGIASFGRERAA